MKHFLANLAFNPNSPRLLSASRPHFALLLWLLTTAAGPATYAQEGPDDPAERSGSFVRFTERGTDAGRVETAIRTYRNGDGVEVRLFAAVHVGDRRYYRTLQRRFSECDALLYEMVREEEDAPPSGEGMTSNPVSQVQIGMKTMLDLEFQLEAIDYSATNFVHADLTPDEFFRLQQERRESILGLMIRLMLEEQARLRAGQGQPLDGLQLMLALLDSDRAHALKLVFGRQMGQLESMLAGFEEGSGEKGSVIVGARNARAIEVMEREVKRGRKRLGIFYGAAHMPDLENRLKVLGYLRVSEEWITAWDIRRKKAKGR